MPRVQIVGGIAIGPRPVIDGRRAVAGLAAVVVLVVTGRILWNYSGYAPPDFASDFLSGRQGYFFGSYRWAFYPHIAAGPLTLVLGLALMNRRLLTRRPAWHRRLGKLQIALVLLVLTPSGLVMAARADGGPIAKAGFATLSVMTAAAAALGWRQAVRRKFRSHEAWMTRCFALLCSAVLARLIGGAFVLAGTDGEWTYEFSSWFSWLLPLLLADAWLRSRPPPITARR